MDTYIGDLALELAYHSFVWGKVQEKWKRDESFEHKI